MASTGKALQRRENLRKTLVRAAERTIAREGVGGLRARTLADAAGCAVGAIYNVVADLDELIMLVNERTLVALEQHLTKSVAAAGQPAGAVDAITRLVAMAVAYLEFANKYDLRWRAVFDHRLAEGGAVPDWYLASQRRLFGYVEELLRALQPSVSAERRALLARTLFSAVHGVVELGLDQKLQPIPVAVLREQVAVVTTAVGRGIAGQPA
jgi:AcrR family transcriptional regulator